MSWMVASVVLILQFLQTLDIKKETKEKLQEIIDKLNALAPTIPAPPAVPAVPTLVITEPRRNNRYEIFDIDLTKAHTDEPLGIQDKIKVHGVKFATYMTVLAAPSPFSYKINAKEAPVCDAVVGDEWGDFEIEEIYYSNAAAAGTGKIHIEFRVD